MKKNQLILISLGMLLGGVLLFGYFNEYIIFRFSQKLPAVELEQQLITKKRIAVYYWNFDRWHYEDIELLWPDDVAEQIAYIVNAWLTVMDEEEVSMKKVAAQTVMVNKTTAYISFDREPFDKEAPIIKKLMWVEALLKTISLSGSKVQDIQFLVHHQKLIDSHLDFTNPWPVIGFVDDKGDSFDAG